MRSTIPLPPSCDRTPDDLLYGVRSAIDMQDVNQLAKHYHWPGATDLQAEKLMDRLEATVNAPLIDIQLLYAGEPESSPALIENEQYADSAMTEEFDYPVYPPAPVHRAPYALRVTQFLSSTNTQAQSSTFRLQRHFECWWIRY